MRWTSTSGLFGAEQWSMQRREELLEGLPQVSPEEKAALHCELTLEELTAAVHQMASGRAPGIDGLSTDFLKRFWNTLGPDLHAVLLECFGTGSLPVSCQQAVLSLLPKKENLALLKNWRPVSLLCTDYKLSSRGRALVASSLVASTLWHRTDCSDTTKRPGRGCAENHLGLFWSVSPGGMWLFEEPLFFNSLINTQTLQSASTSCTKLGHLSQLINRVVEEVCAALPQSLRTFTTNRSLCDQWSEGGQFSFPSLAVTPAVGKWQEGGGQLLSFTTPRLDKFRMWEKKEVYQVCIRVLNMRSLAGMKESRWTQFFGPEFSPKASWRSLYKLPVEKRTADLQWRVIYGAIATNRYRVHLDPEVVQHCVFCSQVETLEHLFVQCPRLAALSEVIKKWFQGFGEDFSFDFVYFWSKYSVKKKTVHTLMNFLSGCAKLAIWLMHRNRAQSAGSVEPVSHTYYQLTDNMQPSVIPGLLGEFCALWGEMGELIVNTNQRTGGGGEQEDNRRTTGGELEENRRTTGAEGEQKQEENWSRRRTEAGGEEEENMRRGAGGWEKEEVKRRALGGREEDEEVVETI
ncbi:hypothetical protein L3Q82_016316 [Scortum barcoo]|uniref:Uncharacterized protein n=1 Tax=Scortum barcoo TaxID=214431 RepID=A0ACB8VQN6_9TELE|nr:hypothetical protein L3Q82_016316 [Scortum barcoo]